MNQNIQETDQGITGQQPEAVERPGEHGETGDIAASQKPHMRLGVLGAAIGCLLGEVVWSYVMGQGYITVYGGIIMILLSFGGYKLFSWNLGTEGMSVSVAMSAVMLPFATYGGFIWFLDNNISVFARYSSLSFLEKWQQTWGVMREHELIGEFFKCLGNGYLFMLVAAFLVYTWLRRLER